MTSKDVSSSLQLSLLKQRSYLNTASTSAATTKQQANLDITDATKSDDDAKAAAATSVATTNQEANLDLIEAAKSDGEAKAITATSVAITNEQADSDLREAAKSDDEAKAVAALTQSGVDVNCRGHPGYRFTPLILAIHFNSMKVARVLLADPRVDVNATDTSGRTGLHRATGHRLSAIILSQRIDIDWNVFDKTGRTPLLHLARMNCLRNIQELSRIKSVELFATSIDGFTVLVDLLLKWEGIHVAALDTKGLSPFHYSIQNGHSGVLKLLLEKLENIGEPFTFCDEWLAPLDHSIQRGHLEVVKLLLEKGEPFTPVNYEKQMSMFENLLHVATEHNKKEIAVYLLDTLGLRTQLLARTITQSSSHRSVLLAVAARANCFKIIRHVLNWYREVDPNASIGC